MHRIVKRLKEILDGYKIKYNLIGNNLSFSPDKQDDFSVELIEDHEEITIFFVGRHQHFSKNNLNEETEKEIIDLFLWGISVLRNFSTITRGCMYGQKWGLLASDSKASPFSEAPSGLHPNPLKSYFDSHSEGRGIWKWMHYFDIYHRHFKKFVGHEVHILEIGIYAGGSLKMWRDYFGLKCHVYGVDIQEACKSYENEYTKIFVGDQGDRHYWGSIKKKIPRIDIIVDDGSHDAEHQIVTLEEMLPHLSAGGVYLCEDVHYHPFASYLHGLVLNLNEMDGGAVQGVKPKPFQSQINSIHFYPYVAVIEKNDSPVKEFTAPKHGTEWEPF